MKRKHKNVKMLNASLPIFQPRTKVVVAG